MKDYVILTDAAADPADQIAKEYPFVKIIPMSVSIAGREYIWGGETGTLTCEEFYSLLRSGYFGSTSSISPGIYFSYFEEYLMQGLSQAERDQAIAALEVMLENMQTLNDTTFDD